MENLQKNILFNKYKTWEINFSTFKKISRKLFKPRLENLDRMNKILANKRFFNIINDSSYDRCNPNDSWEIEDYLWLWESI